MKRKKGYGTVGWMPYPEVLWDLCKDFADEFLICVEL